MYGGGGAYEGGYCWQHDAVVRLNYREASQRWRPSERLR